MRASIDGIACQAKALDSPPAQENQTALLLFGWNDVKILFVTGSAGMRGTGAVFSLFLAPILRGSEEHLAVTALTSAGKVELASSRLLGKLNALDLH